MSRNRNKVGLWMIGAAGGVGSTTALGIAALKKRAADDTSLVTALPEFAPASLISPGAIVVGGHEIRSQTLLEAVRCTHAQSNIFDPDLIKTCAPLLRQTQRHVRPGIVYGATPRIRAMADGGRCRRAATAASAVEMVRDDLESFRRKNRLDHVVVVNIASSEPGIRRRSVHATYASLAKAMTRKGANILPPSSIYALGAFSAGCSYINFTPSVGARLPAIEELARRRGALYMGCDGKTGETLVKSVLAPMFAMRNLRVRTWVGHNILGNRDGQVLSDPAVKASKIKSKDRLLAQVVGYKPESRTSIEFVPSLGDWKVAWDLIHFEGFLGTKMNMQFVWTGSDSILAAPLVIDLVRLTEREYRLGRSGRMKHLAYFFKDPLGVKSHSLVDQWHHLVAHTLSKRGDEPQ